MIAATVYRIAGNWTSSISRNRGTIEIVLRQRGQPTEPVGPVGTSGAVDPTGLIEGNPLESDRVSWAKLTDAIEVGRDYVRDVRVSPHRPAGDPEYDRLPSG